jgi:two-component system LytT family sensor kinase
MLRTVQARSALRLSAIVWLFGYILVELGAMAQGRSTYGEMFLANLPLLLSGILLSFALGLLLERLSARPTYQRLIAMGAAGLVAGLAQTIADDAWLRAVSLTLIPSWQEWAVPYQPQRLFMILVLYLWTMYLTVALLWASHTSAQARIDQARAATFEAAALRAEAAALRLQLNPHFIFNTLNGIASLVVRQKQEEAEEMIDRLASFMRASFASDPTGLVTLEQEFDTIAAYLDIETARFGDRLRVEIALPAALRGREVPNFLLQPLVENAIKHGAGTGDDTLSVAVTAKAGKDETILSVVNHRQSRPAEPTADGGPVALSISSGIGLANTRQRLAAHYGAAAWIECRPLPGGYRAEIGVPASQPEAVPA